MCAAAAPYLVSRKCELNSGVSARSPGACLRPLSTSAANLAASPRRDEEKRSAVASSTFSRAVPSESKGGYAMRSEVWAGRREGVG